MLINFLGTFHSGKTTLASKLFSYLKEHNINSEFIPEQARIYIANKRYINPNQPPTLFNSDQLNILNLQYQAEKLMLEATDDKSVIITDSSTYNTILYMDNDYIKYFANNLMYTINEYYKTKQVVTFILGDYIHDINNTDPNRIHTDKDIEKINIRLAHLIYDSKYIQTPTYMIYDQDLQSRFNQCLEIVNDIVSKNRTKIDNNSLQDPSTMVTGEVNEPIINS